MSYTTTSSFPTNIDDRVFISDPTYSNKSVVETHRNYIDNSEYTNASDYINAQSNITPITADLFNMIGNRIIALQTYLLTIESCYRCKYGTQPSSPIDGEIWIE